MLVDYADTDAGGVVHHTSSLRWFESARAAWIRERGTTLTSLVARGFLCVVAKITIDYREPLHLEEEIVVTAQTIDIGNCSLLFAQQALRAGIVAIRAEVRVTSINSRTRRPQRLPSELAGG